MEIDMNNLLSLFRMDPLRDVDKASSSQMMIEDMDTKRNLTQRAIEAINEIDVRLSKKY
jgi:hypothetical protein